MDDRWPVWKLAALLYLFATGVVAINLFMLGLMGQAISLSALSPLRALIASLALGVPVSWASGLWVRHLLDEAAKP